MSGYNVAQVRRHFPALQGDEVLMDNAGGAQVPQAVISRMTDYLMQRNVQLGASYERSAHATEAVAAARRTMAALVGTDDPNTLLFGDSTTGLLARLARAMAPQLDSGDEIVISEADHESNIGPWMRLRDRGIVIRTWSVRRDPERLDLGDLDALLNDRTRLVCVTQCSNILGSETPIPEIAERVHAAGAELLVDGVGWAAHRLPDMAALGADYYAISLYKVFGPHIGLMWGRRAALERLSNQNHFFFDGAALPYPLQPGGMNYEAVVAAAGIVDYLCALGRDCGAAGDDPRTLMHHAFAAIAAHETELATRILDFLDAQSGVRVVGDPKPGPTRLPIISFTVDGVAASRIPPHLDKRGIGIRWGDFYARRLIEALGLHTRDGVVRISLAHYNTHDEVDRLLDGLSSALAAEGR